MSGAIFMSPTKAISDLSLPDFLENQLVASSKKSSLCLNFSFIFGSGISPPAGT